MENYFCTLDDDFLDFCDSMEDYCDVRLDSPCSNFSDQENISLNSFDSPRSNKNPVKRVQQRRAANMRERRRMRSINDAFDTLRTCIPSQVNTDRRLSKVDTLKLAIRYIGYLGDVIQTYDEIGADGRKTKMGQRNEKVILRCNITDITEDGENTLLGHSLSWVNDRVPRKNDSNRLTAKIWIPAFANESDLVTLSTFTSEYTIQ